MKRHIPNILTLFRIALVPVYLICLYLIGDASGALLALIVFVVAGITDYFDGMLARKFKSISDFGKVADPLADKIIVSVALISIALFPMKFISIIIVIIIIFRELMVTLLRGWYQKKDIYVAANIWGKLKTTLQMIGVILALAFHAGRFRILLFQENEELIIKGLEIFFWFVAVITIVSGITYLPFMAKKEGKED
jgi:CDP-diacylglycerol--glycerol-3-phosphate 3-phosphatidyltransferase